MHMPNNINLLLKVRTRMALRPHHRAPDRAAVSRQRVKPEIGKDPSIARVDTVSADRRSTARGTEPLRTPKPAPV